MAKIDDISLKEKSVPTSRDKSPMNRDLANKEKVNDDTDADSGPEEVPVSKVIESELIASAQELKNEVALSKPVEREPEINSTNETIRKSRKRHRTHKNRSMEQVNDTMDLKTSGSVQNGLRNFIPKRRRLTLLEKVNFIN